MRPGYILKIRAAVPVKQRGVIIMKRYALKHYDKILIAYRDRDWAIHSAECYASFYDITVAVVDTKTGEVIAVRQPKLTEEAR